ncbi:RsmB/NOP family class I SAM-dependent RNA methyltransferase [Niabella hibiscisoli]|uniref:hypothetical protein n=1 Tax=Niabella hibiscisoli TaxID=1825928 RepID=UPI001F115690|nr:hypothetical protein [Niabella hibiscisoli]MCH5721052.1 hypothetical protein [Niabella hibiscisoli]
MAHPLSVGIDSEAFTLSHLVQPDLFLRIRPGHKDAVIDKLKSADVPFVLTDDRLRLNNSVRIEDVVKVNQEVVVQDLSSQRVAELLQLYTTVTTIDSIVAVWDCCAASGGKSILAYDTLKKWNSLFQISDLQLFST